MSFIAMEGSNPPENARGRPTSRDTVFRPSPPPCKHRLTITEMMQIAYDCGSGLSDRQTAKNRQHSPSTVGRIRKEVTGEIVRRINFDGFPVLLSHFVAFSLLANPSATGQTIAEAAREAGLETSKASINRVAEKIHFHCIIKQKTERLTQRHKEYRLYFAENIVTWTGFYLPWVFTDESMLILNPVRKRIRVIRGLECEQKYVAMMGYPIKLMVWGAIARNFKSPLVRIEGKVTATTYQNMLISSQIIEKLNSHFGTGAFVFQQDGARPHTAASTLQFLEANALTLPADLHWPAMSPDLSVIENLWSILKYRMDYTAVTNSETLYTEAARVWDQISIETVNKCIDDFDPRLKACAALHGESLNEHKAILAAFRQSSSQGMACLRDSISERDCLRNFCQKSAEFFATRTKQFIPRSRLPNEPERRDIERQNIQIVRESCQICELLPDRIRMKTGLPLITAEDRAALEQTTLEPIE